MMKKLILALAVLVLSGCAAVVKVEGEQTLNDRMSIRLEEAWNKLSAHVTGQPYELWTQEGVALDHLRLWPGVASGQALIKLPPRAAASGEKAPRVPTFTAGMAPDQLVNLFEVMYSVDGSIVKTTKVDTTSFGGEAGIRFEFTIARKRDDLQMRGVGWIAVRKNELYAATFVAPQLTYYGKLLPKAERVVASARIKS